MPILCVDFEHFNICLKLRRQALGKLLDFLQEFFKFFSNMSTFLTGFEFEKDENLMRFVAEH